MVRSPFSALAKPSNSHMNWPACTTLHPAASEVDIFPPSFSGMLNKSDADYTIDANPEFLAVTDSGAITTVQAHIEAHSVHVSGGLVTTNPAVVPPSLSRKRTVGYTSCSMSQKPMISTAAQSSQAYLTATNKSVR